MTPKARGFARRQTECRASLDTWDEPGYDGVGSHGRRGAFTMLAFDRVSAEINDEVVRRMLGRAA